MMSLIKHKEWVDAAARELGSKALKEAKRHFDNLDKILDDRDVESQNKVMEILGQIKSGVPGAFYKLYVLISQDEVAALFAVSYEEIAIIKEKDSWTVTHCAVNNHKICAERLLKFERKALLELRGDDGISVRETIRKRWDI